MVTGDGEPATLMREVLGAPGYPFAVINHPISSATPAESALQAQQAATACANILTRTTDARPNAGLGRATGAEPDNRSSVVDGPTGPQISAFSLSLTR